MAKVPPGEVPPPQGEKKNPAPAAPGEKKVPSPLKKKPPAPAARPDEAITKEAPPAKETPAANGAAAEKAKPAGTAITDKPTPKPKIKLAPKRAAGVWG